jgi:carboxyl-terminal processing protease
VWRSANRIPDNTPLVVLVDVNSASASEILAGALQDHDRAPIVGERTFGKGLVQSIIDLPGGSGLTLTTARYFTPSGRSIQRDYSSGNLYDYYNHRGATGTTGPQAATTNHRKVFGGDGIQPDEPIAASRISRSELELLDSIFFFTRAIVTNRPSDQQKRVSITRSSGDIADGIISDFAGFTAREGSSEPAFGPNETTFVKTRLKFSLMMAEQGATAANRVLISADPQVARAAEVLPRARQLAMSSRKTAIRQ